VEATGSEHRDLRTDRVDHLRQEQRGGHRAGVAAALTALGDDQVDAEAQHLLGVPPGPDGGHGQDAGVVQLGDGVLGRRPGEADELHAFLGDEREALVEVGLVRPEVDPERVGGVLLDRPDRVAHLIHGHGHRCEDAEAARRAGGRGEAGTGHPAHARLHDRVADVEQLADPGVERRVQRVGVPPWGI